MNIQGVMQAYRDRYGEQQQKQAAEAIGISQPYLSDILNGKREPSEKFLEALGLERVVTYRKRQL